MPRIQLDTSTLGGGLSTTSPRTPSSPFSPYLPSPNTASTSRRSSGNTNTPFFASSSSLPWPLSLPKRKLITLVGLTVFVVFLFGWNSSGPPSESGLFAWGRGRSRVPEGEYDPHGSGEGADADEIGGGKGVVLPVESETDLDALALLASQTGSLPVEDPPHLTPASLQTQLTSLIYFLAEGGIVAPNIDTSKEITVDTLLEASDPDLPSTSSFKKAETGWEAYVEKRYPLVIFSKSFCPYSRKAKSIISFLNPSPAPLIIEVDLRPDAASLKTLLTHLTSRSTFPNILLGFVPLGGGDEIELLFAEGGLGKKFKSAGLRVNA